MNRYYVHKYVLDNTILIDREKKTWTFFSTNIWGQFHNLDAEPKKISTQRINGLKKRLSSSNRYYSSDGFVVDQFIYHYIFSDEDRAKASSSIGLSNKLIASGDDLSEVLTVMCEQLLDKRKADPEDRNYYKEKIKELVTL